MSYFCYVHNWTSPNYSCPECHKTETYVSSSTELKLTADVKFESVLAAENKKLCDELSEMTTKLYYQRERLQQAELERDEALANEQASATAYAEVNAELEVARDMINTAVKAWGDYAPVPNSNAGRILRDMKAMIAGAEPKSRGE